MSFRVVVEELLPDPAPGKPPIAVERYRQTVDALNLRLLMDVVNTPPPRKRQRKPKAE